jgi:hypothetical protein
MIQRKNRELRFADAGTGVCDALPGAATTTTARRQIEFHYCFVGAARRIPVWPLNESSVHNDFNPLVNLRARLCAHAVMGRMQGTPEM